ncbi:MAG: TM0106 family RecB-like putative nuclease [Pseudomonadota bacterium]
MKKKTITATDLYNFKKCRYRPFMDFNGDPKLKIEIHPLVKLLWDAGVQYEAKVIETIKKENPEKSFVAISPDKPLSDELAKETLIAMQQGVDLIYQGVLMADGRAGRPDLLVKKVGSSSLGDHLYYPMDIKLARVDGTWDNGGEKINIEHIWQLYFYSELLERVQGTRLSKSYIYKTKSRKLHANLYKKPYQYDEAISLLNSYLRGDPCDSEPAICGNCKMCEWKKVCLKWAKEKEDVSLLYWVGQGLKRGLKKLGIETIDALSKQDYEQILPSVQDLIAQGYFWPSIPMELIKKSIQRAKVYKQGVPVINEKNDFPQHDTEIHFDVEDDPTQDFVYLYGILLVQRGRKPEYHSFFAERFEDEEKITQELFEFLKQYKGAPVYHYSNYEKTTLERLLKRYNTLDETVYQSLFGENGTAVDLYKIILDKTDWPLSSYSLKDICRSLGFEWAAEDASGSSSIVWINEYLQGNKDMKNKILRYNEDDCQATYFLKSELIKMQKR